MHRRRGVGVGARKAAAPKFQKKAEELKANSMQSAIDTVQKLEAKLTQFAKKHSSDIRKDPAFRQQFLQMCAPLGVDPLLSEKSFWTGVLGMGDFYYELSVKVAEACLASRSRNGGIMSVTEVQSILAQRKTKFHATIHSDFNINNTKQKKKQQQQRYTKSDIQIAIQQLAKLGGGFRTIEVGSSTMIVSVPTELDQDHMTIMTLAKDKKHYITLLQVIDNTGWSEQRAQRALQLLLQEGMAWLDKYQGEENYWFPSLWQENMEEEKDE